MKIDVTAYEAKKYYILVDEDSGDEVIELDEPKKVLFDGNTYLSFVKEDWKALKSKLGITKNDDEITYDDVLGEDYMDEFEKRLKELGVKGYFYTPDSDQPYFVDEIMENSYIIFCEYNNDEIENDVIYVFKGGEIYSSCYGVCHQPFIDKFWSFGNFYHKVEYYELDCVEHIRTNYRNVDVYLILEPDNKEERLRVLRRDCGNDQNSYWEYVVMRVDQYNKYHADEDDDK